MIAFGFFIYFKYMDGRRKVILNYSLNIIIIIIGCVCLYLAYSLVSNAIGPKKTVLKESADTTKKQITNQPNLSVQVDLQNGTGENRIAARFRDYLKQKGFDVVDMGNYKTSDVDKTLVIDKTGDMNKARRVADALGVSGRNVIQQINKSQFLDATIVIGRDFNELKPFLENKANK